MSDLPDTPRPGISTSLLVVGVAIVVIGIGLTLDNLIPGYGLARILFKLWPLVLVVLGFLKLRQDRGNVAGWILVIVGALFTAALLGHGQLIDLIFPLILVSVGIVVVLKALRKGRQVPPELARHESFIQGTAIFSGFKRRVGVLDFKGGELTAIFGGFELDLRQAAMEGEQVRIDVFVLFGGGEIMLPPGWEVMNRITAIAGGVDDKTYPPAAGETPRNRLLLTGTALFGGVELKS